MKNLQNHIFSETACISKETLLKFVNQSLSQKELHDVQKHLLDCEFCSEALEGLTHAKNPSVFFEIDHKISTQSKSTSNSVTRMILVAASLLLIAIGSYYTVVNFNKATGVEGKLAIKNTEVQHSTETTIEHNEADITIQKVSKPSHSAKEIKASTITEQKTPAASPTGLAYDNKKGEVQKLESDVIESTTYKDEIAESFSLKEEPIQVIQLNSTTTNDGDIQGRTVIDKIEDVQSKDNSQKFLNQAVSTSPSKSKRAESNKKTKTGITTKSATDAEFYSAAPESSGAGVAESFEKEEAEPHPLTKGKNFYQAKSYDKAIEQFDIILNQPKTTSSSYEAKWYKSLCLIELKKNEQAKKLLSELTFVNNPYAKNAEDLLKTLK